ncbi:MAG: CRTAC1 family protein [Planctomycetota bacterium]
MRTVFWVSTMLSALCSVARSDDGSSWRFEDVGAATGLDFVQRSGTAEQRYIVDVKSTGVALLDFDGDGLLDVFLSAGSSIERHLKREPGYGCRLYRNLGELRFEDVTSAAQIPSDFGWVCGAAAADIDGDGRDDLLVTCIGPDRLLRNVGGRFEEITARAGLGDSGWNTSAAFADLDLDGDLDLYVCGYVQFDFANPPEHGKGFSCLWKDLTVVCGPRGFKAEPDRVYRNRGDGTFDDVSAAWGFDSVPAQFGLGVIIGDFAGDSLPDVYVANDSSPSFLFVHRGDRFEEIGYVAGVSVSEDGQEQAGMGVDSADIDGDRRMDLVKTNFEGERNNLYFNHANESFFDAADQSGFGPPGQDFLGWGVGVRDFNNDGVLDIFVANGHVYPQADEVRGVMGYPQRNQLFVGQATVSGRQKPANARFLEQGEKLGFTQKHVSRAAAFGDLDNDGDIDIIETHINGRPSLYENHAPVHHKSLTLQLSQPGLNPQALGARVEVSIGDVKRTYEVRRNASFQASNDARLHVGLGVQPPAGAVEVVWPDGGRERFATVEGGGLQMLSRGAGVVLAPPAGKTRLAKETKD